IRSEMVSTVAKLPSANCRGSSSTTGGGGTWVRIDGALGTETRGRSAREGLARPARPSRCTLPITALRVTPPRARAIWLAESPSVHNVLSCSTRSSDQFIWFMAMAPSPPRPPGIPDIVPQQGQLTRLGEGSYRPCPHDSLRQKATNFPYQMKRACVYDGVCFLGA